MKTSTKWIAAVGVCVAFNLFAKEQIFLGPPNSRAASEGASWVTGANGGGFTYEDFDDPPHSGFDFTITNTVAGNSNNADWRCPPFSLGPAANGGRPMSFSFAYKLTDAVAKGNNIHVQLRFFDSTGTNFISEIVLPIGARTGDSKMNDYKTHTIENILAPRKAATADIWVDANIFEPWISGTARFGDFSVTTAPRSLLFKISVTIAVLTGVSFIVCMLIHLWRHHISER
jgi:hypothetical protein